MDGDSIESKDGAYLISPHAVSIMEVIKLKVSIFIILLLFTSNCFALEESDVSCVAKYEQYAYQEFNPKISGERSLESFTKGIEGIVNSARMTRIYGLALRRDTFTRGELIFSINIKGDGTVIGLDNLYTPIDNCEFIKNILIFYSKVKYESISNLNDLSVFVHRIVFGGKNL